MRASARLGILALLLVAVAFASGWAVSRFVQSPADALARTAPPPSTELTAPVTRQVVSRTMGFDATAMPLHRTELRPIVNAGDVRTVVTRNPLKVGDTAKAGDTLLELNGRPILALPGPIPMYRNTSSGDSGPDVAQLQAGLAAAGLSTAPDPVGVWGTGTDKAVRSLYTSRGFDPATGPGPAAGTTSPRITIPAGEILYVPELPAVVTANRSVVGQDITGVALTLGSGPLVLIGQLPVDEDPPTAGALATLVFADGHRATGTVQSLTTGPPPSTATGDSPPGQQAPTADVSLATVVPDSPDSAITSGSTLRVLATLAASPGPLLAVPLAALRTAPDGSTFVVVAGPPRRVVSVTPGMQGDGLVGVIAASGVTLNEGEPVVVGTAVGGQGPDEVPTPGGATNG